jgi:hypothetical protein
MFAMWCHGLRGRRGTTQRRQEEPRRQERWSEETLRNDPRTTTLHCRSDDPERRAKDDSTSESRNHNNAIKRNIEDANHLTPRSNKNPRLETTKGEEAGVIEKAYKKAYKEDPVADSLSAPLPRSSVENGEFQALLPVNERLQQELDPSLSCHTPCSSSKGDAAADARIQKLEQELHLLEQELKNENQLEQELPIVEEQEELLKNENQLVCEEDEKLHADAVHKTTTEATANGTYRARWTNTNGLTKDIVIPSYGPIAILTLLVVLP